jgi:hypothetical protein
MDMNSHPNKQSRTERPGRDRMVPGLRGNEFAQAIMVRRKTVLRRRRVLARASAAAFS